MKRMLILSGIVVLMFIVTSCAKAPKCADADVKQLATEISGEIIINGILGDSTVEIGQKLNPDDPYEKELMGKIGYIPGSNYFYKGAAKANITDLKKCTSPAIKELLSSLETRSKNIQLDSIRMSSTDDKIKKCSCEADLTFDKTAKLPIKYEAQKTEEGKVRVEVHMDLTKAEKI